jgi:HSP20 family protein
MSKEKIKPPTVYRSTNEFEQPLGWDINSDWAPPVDIEEDEQVYEIKVDLPGIEKNDIKIKTRGSILTITGERKIEHRNTKKYRIEKSYGIFIRSFTLPLDADTDGIQSSFNAGVLKINIQKKEIINKGVIDIEIK